MGKVPQGFVVMLFWATLLFSKENAQSTCLASSWNIFNSREEVIKLSEEITWGEND